MKHETGDDHGCRLIGRPRRVLAGGCRGAPVMIRTPRHPRRRLLAVGACAAVLLMSERRPPAAASAEDCREFHQECTEARAAGYSDVGICHVERLECSADRDADVPKRSHEARGDDGDDPERSIGERSIGP